MTKHPEWPVSCAWLSFMGIVWALFVPKGLSVGTFALFTLAGPLSLLVARQGWAPARP